MAAPAATGATISAKTAPQHVLGEEAWGRMKITATGDDGETFVVSGDDLYAAACELAEMTAMELRDGWQQA